MYVPGKLPTYPSLNLTFCPKWEVRVNVRFGRGRWVVSQKHTIIHFYQYKFKTDCAHIGSKGKCQIKSQRTVFLWKLINFMPKLPIIYPWLYNFLVLASSFTNHASFSLIRYRWYYHKLFSTQWNIYNRHIEYKFSLLHVSNSQNCNQSLHYCTVKNAFLLKTTTACLLAQCAWIEL